MTNTNRDDQLPPVRTTVSIPADDYAELERVAKRMKVSVAWVVREAIEKYLKSGTPLFTQGT